MIVTKLVQNNLGPAITVKVNRHDFELSHPGCLGLSQYFYGLVQGRHNSSVLAVELRLSCTNTSILSGKYKYNDRH